MKCYKSLLREEKNKASKDMWTPQIDAVKNSLCSCFTAIDLKKS